MEKPLISIEEYEFFLNSGRPYIGYVWTKEGKIFEVEENRVMVVKPKPTWPLKSCGDSHRTVFFDTLKHPQISLLELGSNDVLYNESGEFVSVIEANDPVKGEIKILKSKINFDLPDSLWDEKWKDYEIVDLKDITLSSKAYSRIFTHILSFMKDVDLRKIRNWEVSVQLRKKGKEGYYIWDLYNLSYAGDDAQAFHSGPQNHAVAAVIKNFSGDNTKLYSTLWNVQNMLGAHEFTGHVEKGWNDKTYTHHLAYLFQMNHETWKNTTDFFKDYQKDNFRGYVFTNHSVESNSEADLKLNPTIPGNAEKIEKAKEVLPKFKILRQNRLIESDYLHGRDSTRFYDDLTRRISNPMYRNPFDEK